MKLRLPAIKRLRWKLTFSYVLSTALVVLVIEILIFLIIFFTIERFFIPSLALDGLQQYPDQLSLFFVHNGTPDHQALALWIKHSGGFSPGYQSEFLAIVDREGRVVASNGTRTLQPGILLHTELPAQAAANLQQLLAGSNNTQGLKSTNADGTIIAMVPIRGEDNRVDGALIENTGPRIYSQLAFYWLRLYTVYLLEAVAAYTFVALITGMIANPFIARTITRRFNTLATAADNWSQGNFSTFVQDPFLDELGQLSQKLDNMAEQLQNLLQARQKLAILEERNRLARDLHDSVKQHIFVVALQVGTAKLRLEHGQDTDEAQRRLSEADRVLHQVQDELKTLIRELRPVALEGKGLRPALQELVAQWQRQTGIPVNLRANGNDALPVLAEEALFRVAQEALSNVARHSHATDVQVQLLNEPDGVTLALADNGQGFDAAASDRKGVGLLSMRERMQALGGDVEIESQPGKGTRVTAHCPGQLSEV